MSDPITNPVVIAFLNNRVRPRAEQIRALLHLLQDDRDEFLAEGIGSASLSSPERSSGTL